MSVLRGRKHAILLESGSFKADAAVCNSFLRFCFKLPISCDTSKRPDLLYAGPPQGGDKKTMSACTEQFAQVDRQQIANKMCELQ